MILCTAQISPCWDDPAATLKKIADRSGEAVEHDASFIAFPEQITTGWNPKESSSYVQDESGDIVSSFREIARDYSIGILGSFRERHEPRPLNTAIAIGADGHILAKYSKIHPFSPGGEDMWYDAGDKLGLFTYDGCRCGIAICYDLRFSDLFRLYRMEGVHLMLVPSAWPSSRMKFFDLFSTTRAIEYQFFLAGINTVGETPVDHYSGGSCIIAPDGSRVDRCGDNEELLFSDIDPSVVEDVRKNFRVFEDEKRDIYRRLDGKLRKN